MFLIVDLLSLLQVVVATGTLALGIHMPCKTVVFAGDSLYLNSVQYRQVNLPCSSFEIPSHSTSFRSVCLTKVLEPPEF